tara:strand:+ start:2372 stop:2890 length:519 start_codon:yes stop_codon:yes gene_type:complete
MNIKHIAYIVTCVTLVVTTIVGFISTSFMSSYKEMYMLEINNLRNELAICKMEMKEKASIDLATVVDVTMYRPNVIECDSDPDVTADGTRLIIPQASRYRYVALSRNLLKRWGGKFDYGDYIVLQGADSKDGIYQVRDTMNPKFHNVVDILESQNVRPYKFENVKLYKLTLS